MSKKSRRTPPNTPQGAMSLHGQCLFETFAELVLRMCIIHTRLFFLPSRRFLQGGEQRLRQHRDGPSANDPNLVQQRSPVGINCGRNVQWTLLITTIVVDIHVGWKAQRPRINHGKATNQPMTLFQNQLFALGTSTARKSKEAKESRSLFVLQISSTVDSPFPHSYTTMIRMTGEFAAFRTMAIVTHNGWTSQTHF